MLNVWVRKREKRVRKTESERKRKSGTEIHVMVTKFNLIWKERKLLMKKEGKI